MAYKKKHGIISCVLVGYTKLWIDAVNNKSGQSVTIFLRNKMSEKMQAAMVRDIESALVQYIIVERMEESGHYKFICFSKGQHLGIQKRVEREISYQALEHEIDKDYNPVRSGKGQKLAVAGTGRAAFNRTGGKLSNSLINVDNSAVWREELAEAQAMKKRREDLKLLQKLRRKYFFDREWLVGADATDLQWDKFLLENNQSMPIKPVQSDIEFEQKLKEAGLL